MIPKYTVEYATTSNRSARTQHYGTDDPVACEEFIVELLDRSRRIRGIKHEGMEMSKADFDRMIRTAGGMLAAKHVCASLNIKPDEEKFRFGFAS